MTYIFGDGFDFYNDNWNNQWQLGNYGGWTSTWNNLHTRSNITRFSTGKALSFDHQTGLTKKFGVNTSNTVYISFSMYLNTTLAGSENYLRIETWQGNGFQLTICFIRNGNIEVYRGDGNGTGTLIATFTSVYTQYSWNHYQFKIVYDNVAGSVTLRKNGDLVDTFTATGLNTRNTANSYIDEIRLTQPQYWNQIVWIDDFLVSDSSGPTLNTWPGDIRCYALRPNGAGDQTDFTSTPTQANYLSVDEADPDGADYTSANVVGNTDLFAMTDLPSTPAVVHAVVARAIVQKADAGARSGALVLKSGTTVSPGTSTVLLTNWQGLVQAYPTNPDTGTAWTYGTVNSMQAGYKVSG